MANSNIFLGNIKIVNAKLGLSDVKLCLGETIVYPTSVPLTDAVVTCSDATYNGVVQTAQDIVVVFSGITLVEDVDYIVTKNNGGTNVGVYEVEIQGINDYEDYASGTFTINKVTPTVTAPTANSLTYNASAQQLADAGSTNWGTLQYSLDNSTYGTSVPSGTNATSYTVYYRVVGDSNINSVAAASISCSIGKANGSVTTAPSPISGLIYNGSSQSLVTAGVGTGTMLYKVGSDTWSEAIPSGINATSYTVYYKANESSNYFESASGSVSCSIAKVTPTVVSPVPNVLTYNGSAQELVTAGSTNFGTLKYKVGSDSWSTSIPTRTRGGAYTVSWKVVGDSNINDIPEDTVACSINEKPVTAIIVLSQTAYTYNGNACQPTVTAYDGGTVIDPSEYTVTYSNNTNAGTATVTIYDVVGGDYYVEGSTTFTVNKAECCSTAPTAKSLTYNGSAQYLVNAGSSSCGTMQYSSDNSTWSASIPSQTGANTYATYWRVSNDNNHSGTCSGSVSTTIAKADQSAPTVYGATTTYPTTATATASGGGGQGSVEWSNGNTQTSVGSKTTKARWSGNSNYNASPYSNEVTLTMNKANQNAPTATVTTATYPETSTASASGGGGQGTLTWTNGSSRTAIGTQTTKAYWAGNGNYNASSYSNEVTLSVAKFTPTVTLAATNRAYNGNALYATASVATPSGGKTMKGTIYYGTSSGAQTYSATYTGGSVNLSSVSVTNVGSATVYAYFVPDSTCNDAYNNSSNASKTFSVSKANQSAPTATGATVTYHNTATATASGGGGQGTLTWTNGNTRTATGSQDTYAYWAGNSNYNASPNSNKVTLTVNKATDQSITVTLTNRTYSASSQVVASATSHGCTYYLGFGSSSTSAPSSWGSANSSISQTNAGTYYVWYKGTADANHSADIGATYKGTVTIGKADQSAPTATGATTTYPTTATATASGGGGQGSIEWESAQSQSSVGSHTTRARWSGNSNYNASPYSSYVTVQMNKAAGSVTTAPTNSNPTYGSGGYLCTAGSGTGTMLYKLGSGSYSSTRPTTSGLNAGSYTLYYKASASTNYNESSEASITVTVAKAAMTYTAPSATTYTYNGSARSLVSGGSANGGSIVYPSATVPTETNAGTYTVYWKAVPDGNHSGGTDWTEISCTIAKANQSAPTATGAEVCYGNTATASATGGGGQGSIEWESAQSQSSVGSHTTRARWSGNSNYNASPYSNEVTLKVNATWCNGTTWLGTLTWPLHPYVEIGGIKWATMNVGANSVTDTGLYFQWGDTQGYTAAQVGSGSGQKAFKWEDYKYGNGTSSPGVTGQTKYNSTDSKTVLDASDDAVRANWGGSWRMPTLAEFQALGNAVTTAWTANYQGSGVAGLVCTDKTDSSKVLFFPAAGICSNSSVNDVGSRGDYWSSSLYTSYVRAAYSLDFNRYGVTWQSFNDRYIGFTVRPVVG